MLSLPGAAATAAAGVVRPEAGCSQPWPGWPTISSWWAMTTRRQVGVAARRAAPRCLASSPLPSFLPGPGPLPPPVGPQEEETAARTGRVSGRGEEGGCGQRGGLTPTKGLSGRRGEGRVNPPFMRRSGPAGKRRGSSAARLPGPGTPGGGAASPPPRGLGPPRSPAGPGHGMEPARAGGSWPGRTRGLGLGSGPFEKAGAA